MPSSEAAAPVPNESPQRGRGDDENIPTENDEQNSLLDGVQD